MLTTITLALIETGQGVLGAMAYGLEHIRKDLARESRKQEQAKRMADSVRRDLEMMR